MSQFAVKILLAIFIEFNDNRIQWYKHHNLLAVKIHKKRGYYYGKWKRNG